MKKLLVSAFIASTLFGGMACAADADQVIKLGSDEKWEMISDDQDSTVYFLTPVRDQKELEKDGLIIRVKDKKKAEDIAFKVKPDCKAKRLYITACMDLQKNGTEIHNMTVLPASDKSVLDASDPNGYGKIRALMCGE